MASLAVAICVVLIAWFLFRDSKRRPSFSAALWIPTLMVLVLGSRTPSGWLGPSGTTHLTNDASGNMMDQVFFLTIIVGSFLVASSRGVKWTKILTANFAITAFYLYFLTSSIWSDYPVDSLIRIVKDFASTVVVISVILTEKDPLDALRAVYIRCACILFPLSVLLIKYKFSDFGRIYTKGGDTMVVGVATYKNSLGQMAMVLSLFLVWDYLDSRTDAKGPRRWDQILLLLMGAYLINVSQSKTSLVCLLIGVILIFTRGPFSSRIISKVVFAAGLMLPFAVFSMQQFSTVFAPVLDALGRDATLTGRTDIWQHITLTTVNPLIGAGFWNFWGGEGGQAITNAMQTTIPNAHNGYLDAYIDGGFIGLMILFWLLVSSARHVLRNLYVNRYQRVRFAFLIITLVVNLAESNFARPSLVWFTTVLVFLEFPMPKPRETYGTEGQEKIEVENVLEIAR